MPVEVDEEFIRARVDFELKLKQAQGNHFSMDTITFRGVQLQRKAEWFKQMTEAIAVNTTCTELDLSQTGLTDTALQQLAATLAVPTRCPKLRKLNLGANPELSKMGETVASGLSKLRVGLEVVLTDGLDAKAEGFVHDKQLVDGKTSWPCDEIKVPEGTLYDYYCPESVIEAAGPAAVASARAEEGTPDGERLRLKRGFQGPNGTRYTTTFAVFEHLHQTGNIVLQSLQRPDSEGIVV